MPQASFKPQATGQQAQAATMEKGHATDMPSEGGDSHDAREAREARAAREQSQATTAAAASARSAATVPTAPQGELGETKLKPKPNTSGAEGQEGEAFTGPDAGILPQLSGAASALPRQKSGQSGQGRVPHAAVSGAICPVGAVGAVGAGAAGAVMGLDASATAAAETEGAEAATMPATEQGNAGFGVSGVARQGVGGFGLGPDSESSPALQMQTSHTALTAQVIDGRDYPTPTGRPSVSDQSGGGHKETPEGGQETVSGGTKVAAMQIYQTVTATAKPPMFAYGNAPRAPRPEAQRGSTLPVRSPAFGRRAPLPSQNASYATAFGAPPPSFRNNSNTSGNQDETPRPVDRSALTSLIFATTPSASSELLQLPLPSRRQTRRAMGAGVLIPVERLPLLPLPPLPPILDKKLEKVVFSHQSLFPRDAGVFEYPVKSLGEGVGEWEGGVPHYEKLEHVGDAILGWVVTTWLHRCWPGLTCGTATKLRAHLVSNNTLSHLSGMYHLPARLACAPLLRVQTDIRAALVEAYIAGVYFSHPPGIGIGIVTAWLEEMYAPLADFFLQHMRGEYAVLRATVGTSEGRVVTHSAHTASIPANPSLAAPDAPSVESPGEDNGDQGGGGPSSLRISQDAGRRGSVSQPDALEVADERLRPALTALSAHCKDTRTTLEFREKRFRLSSGTLWKISVVVGGEERGEGVRVTKFRARWVAAAQACGELGIEWEPEVSKYE